MSQRDLSIVIKAALQNTDEQIKDLNTEIKRIASNPKLERLQLKINIDDTDIKKLSEQINSLQKQVGSKTQGIKIIDENQLNKSKQVLHSTLDEAVKKYSKLGTIKVDQNIDATTNKLKGFTIQIEKANGLIQKLSFKSVGIANGNDIGTKFLLDNVKVIDQTAKLREQSLQKEQQIRDGISKEQDKQSQKEIQQREKILQEEHKIRKALEEESKEIKYQLELYQRMANIKVQDLQRRFGNNIDKNSVDGLRSQIKDLGNINYNSLDEFKKKTKEVDASIKEVGATAKTASSHVLSFGEMFSTAMVKFPIWLAASTAIFGTKAALESAVGVIIEVDTSITNLKKVMDQDTNFEQMLVNATEQAKELGKTITDVLDAYEEFARQGYSQRDIDFMSEASLIASNVGELDAGKSAEYLTSALIQMKMEAKDAMSIVDAWNNVSNKNATTVEKLAQGWAKAGSTAKVFGMDMHELNAAIGTVTAATKQSGNEIGNFWKFVLPRLTSDPAIDALNKIGVSLTDENGDLREAMDIYRDVAEVFGSLDRMTQSIVTEGLAGKHHISRMTAFLTNIDMYDKMLKDSTNSANSARVENELYLESIAARLNTLKATAQELALAVGESFLTNDFIALVELLRDLALAGKEVTQTIGVLPPVLAAVGIATGLLSTRFKTMVFEATLATKAFQALGIQSKALKLALASTGLGIGLIAVGALLETIIAKMAESRERTEEFNREQKKLTENYQENKKEVNGLVSEYEKYSKLINSTKYTTEDLKKYNEIKRQLADLMPELVIGEDQYGNKIIGSSEAIKAKTEWLEKQLLLQEKLAAIEERERAQKNYDTAKEGLTNAETEIKDFKLGNNFESIDEIVAKLDRLQKKQLELREQGKDLNHVDQNNLEYFQSIVNGYDKLNFGLENARLMYQKASMDIIDNNLKMDDSTNKAVSSMINDFTMFVATLEKEPEEKITSTLEDVTNKFQSNSSLKGFVEDYSNALSVFNNSVDNNFPADKIEENANKAKTAFDNLKKELIASAESGDLSSESLNTLTTYLDSNFQSAIRDSEAIAKLSEEKGISIEEAKLLMAQIEAETGAVYENADAHEEAVKQYEHAVSSIQELQGILNELSESHELSAESINFILDQYPDLLQYMDNEAELIEQIKIKQQEEEQIAKQVIFNKLKDNENFFNQVRGGYQQLVTDLGLAYEGDLKNAKSLAQAKLEVENQLLKTLSQAWSKYYSVNTQQMESFVDKQTGMLTSTGGDYLKWLPDDQRKAMIDSFNVYRGQVKGVQDRFNDIVVNGIGVNFNAIKLQGAGKPSSDKKSSSKKGDQASYTDPTDSIIAQINAESDLIAKKKESIKAQADYYSKTKDYNKEIEATNQLLSEQSNHLNALTTANKSISTEAQKIRDANKKYDTWKWFDGSNEATPEYVNQYNKASKTEQENMEKVFSSLQKLKKAYAENQTEAQGVHTEIIDLGISLKQLKFEQSQREVEKFDDSISKLEHTLSLSESMMSMYEEGTEGYNNELKRQVDLNRELISEMSAKEAKLRSLLSTVPEGSDAWKEYNNQLQDVIKSQVDAQISIKETQRELNDQITDILDKQRDKHLDFLKKKQDKELDSIKKRQEAELDRLEKEKEAAEKRLGEQLKANEEYYDKLIEQKEEQLKLLDEEYEKEDRIKRLREIENEINSVKADKRYEFITEDGQKILTYDRAKITELEKNRDELKEQYEREDIKSAIQAEIDRLNKAKDDKNEILQQELENVKVKYDAEIETTKVKFDELYEVTEEKWNTRIEQDTKKWEELVESARNGTLSFDELFNGEDGWYASATEELKSYADGVDEQIARIKAAYTLLGNINLQTPSGGGGGGGGGGGSKGNLSRNADGSYSYSDGSKYNGPTDDDGKPGGGGRGEGQTEENSYGNGAWKEGHNPWAGSNTYHDGGIVGELPKHHNGNFVSGRTPSKMAQLANKLFNAKPNEQVVTALKGELFVPDKNIPNLFTNLKNLANSLTPNQPVVSQGDTIYQFSNFKIEANDIQQFIKSIDSFRRSIRT